MMSMQEEGFQFRPPTLVEFLARLKLGYLALAIVLFIAGVLCAVNLIIYVEISREKTATGLAIRILATALTLAFGIHFTLIVWGLSVI